MSATVQANGHTSTFSVFPAQTPSVVETPLNNYDPAIYGGNDVVYQNWDSSEATGYSSDTGLFGDDGKFKTIGLAVGGIVPVVIVIVVIAIIIAIVVELKRVNNDLKFTIGGRKHQAPSWLDSIVSSFNDIESERLLNRMFPGGFHDIIDSIEGVYRRYRGLNIADDVKEN